MRESRPRPPSRPGTAARKVPLVPILAGVAAALVLVVGGYFGARIAGVFDRTPTPETSLPPSATATTPTTDVTASAHVPPTPTVTLDLTPAVQVIVSPTVALTPTAAIERDQLPAPTLEAPAPAAELRGETTFIWSYPRQLPPGAAFEVLIWRAGDTEHSGAAEAVTAHEQTFNLDLVPQLVAGGRGEYYWSVRVIRARDGAPLSAEAASRRFVYYPEPPP